MNAFTSDRDLTFAGVSRILEAWEQGLITEEEAFAFAENWADEFPPYVPLPESDPQSVLFALLDTLETMWVQPILKADIPALKEFLRIGQENPVQAWQQMHSYWSTVERQERLAEMERNLRTRRKLK